MKLQSRVFPRKNFSKKFQISKKTFLMESILSKLAENQFAMLIQKKSNTEVFLEILQKHSQHPQAAVHLRSI